MVESVYARNCANSESWGVEGWSSGRMCEEVELMMLCLLLKRLMELSSVIPPDELILFLR